MSEDELTLEELADRSGVEPRTLRSWVSEGLLAPPFKPGRGARYPASNADRALAIRVLKDGHGLSFAEIGRRFMMASEEQIRQWALQAGPVPEARGSARDYVRGLQSRGLAEPQQDALRLYRTQTQASAEPIFEVPHGEPAMPFDQAARSGNWQAELASIERLILHLQLVLEVPALRRSRGAVWTRIAVTPDLELSVRGELQPRERALFEQLADQFRAILTGRTTNV